MPPFVSVLMPCRNEAASIERAVASVLGQSYPPDRMEVLVADGESSDGTRATLDRMASAGARLRVVENPGRTAPRALNRALGVARGDLILRVDAHSVLAPDYVRELVRFLESHPAAWGAGGAMQTAPESPTATGRAIAIVLSHPFGVGNSRFRTGTASEPETVDTVFNGCWRRDVFTRVGVFHEALTRSQDIEMSERIRRAGGTLWRVPAARTTYFARSGWLAYLHHNAQNGIWSLKPALYLGRLPVGWRHLVPLGFVLSLLATALAARLASAFVWLWSLPATSYLALNLVVSVTAAQRARDLRLAPRLAAAFAGLHLAYGAGSLWGALEVALRRLPPKPVRPAPDERGRAAGPVRTTHL